MPKRILSLCLVLVLILSMLPVVGFTKASAATTRTVKLFFQNTDNWDKVYGYVWTSDQTPQLGQWPGKALSKGSNGLYELTVTYTTGTGLNFIFNNGGNGQQTKDLSISDSDLSGCQTWWVNGKNGTPGKYVIPGAPSTAVSNSVKIHFVNSAHWSGVAAYVWTASGTFTTPVSGWEWPGKPLGKDSDGNYLLQINPTLLEGQTLGYLFHNFDKSQTADLSIDYATLSKGAVELWVTPGSTNDDGKYACTTATSYTSYPQVKGNQVTFRYTGSASTVYVAGTFNDWSSSKGKMTKSGSTFTYTTPLEDGIYQYKFVVDGDNWIADPSNSTTAGHNGNSVLYVGDHTANISDDKITVQFHVDKADQIFSGWDAWVWLDDAEGSAYKLQTGTLGDRLVSVTVDSDTARVGFILRKSDWSSQDDTYHVDLKDVKSGTVHYFVDYAGTSGTCLFDRDIVNARTVSYSKMDYESNTFWIKTDMPIGLEDVRITYANGSTANVTVTGIGAEVLEESGSRGHTLSLSRSVTLDELVNLRIQVGKTNCRIEHNKNLFYSKRFAEEYTYSGNDLGSTWSANSTTFKVWAPTADSVSVKLYQGGNIVGQDLMKEVPMKREKQGVWAVTVAGDWQGRYYNYWVSFKDYSVEATDPYADSTGGNGDRGMIVNWDALAPEGWDNDISPNQGMSFNDAIIYELHVRGFTIDANSGVKSNWRGKYLGLTQTGTSYMGNATGLDYLKELGITHVQLMPVFDHNWPDEYGDWYSDYGWGYDPKNYNAPDGRYSTNALDGRVRVTEFQQMVQTLHENGINVIMDVVYNHSYDAGKFCYNQIVPMYFSRFWPDGSWSDGAGPSMSDMATEQSMVRKFIVDSVCHWIEDYHIDGFRFDLAGLIDIETTKEIMNTVRARFPDRNIMFYGEGWASGSTAYGGALTTTDNAGMVNGFGFFNDEFRNAIAGRNAEKPDDTGFATGNGSKLGTVAKYFYANDRLTPSQCINYVSCHDNHTLMNKILQTTNAYWETRVSMNNLSAAVYMMAQGTPYFLSGEEILRERKNGDEYVENGDRSPTEVNMIYWDDIVDKTYAANSLAYYKGLIKFRKNHAALRSPQGAAAWDVRFTDYGDNGLMLYFDGKKACPDEVSDGIIIIYNGSGKTLPVNLRDVSGAYGQKVAYGTWKVCVKDWRSDFSLMGDNEKYVKVGVYDDGHVELEAYSTMILVLGEIEDTNSVYNRQHTACAHTSHNTSGLCQNCGKEVSHSFVSGKCSVCGLAENTPDTMTIYFDNTDGWSKVNLYAWTTAGQITTRYAGNWPGTAMKDLGNGIYSFQLSTKAANVIFNNGSNQTADLTVPAWDSGLNCYKDGKWIAYTPETVKVPTLRLDYPSLSFEDEILYNVYYAIDDTSSVVEMGLMTFATRDANGTMANALEVIPGYVNSGSTYMAQSKGVPAKNLGDALYFKVYAKLTDGSYVYSEVAGYNAPAYAKTVLGDSGSSAKAKALVVAMLNYGAAAQTYFGYKTDSLMNASLTAAQQALVKDYDSSMVAEVVKADSSKAGSFVMNGGYSNIFPTVSFEGAFAINFYFTPSKSVDSAPTFYYWDTATYNSVSTLTKDNATGVVTMKQDGINWGATVEGIAAKDMDSTIYVAGFYTSGDVEYPTKIVTYSLGKYCQTVIDNGEPFGAATAVYGYYAKAYFA